MPRVKRVEMSTWVGTTVVCCGTSRTSSKVKAVARPASEGVRVNAPVLSSMCSSMSGSAPWHFLYFFPLPQGQGSLRPTLGSSRRTVLITSSPPVRAGLGAADGPAGAAWLRAAANAGTGSAAGWLIVSGVARRCSGDTTGAGTSWSITGRSQNR